MYQGHLFFLQKVAYDSCLLPCPKSKVPKSGPLSVVTALFWWLCNFSSGEEKDTGHRFFWGLLILKTNPPQTRHALLPLLPTPLPPSLPPPAPLPPGGSSFGYLDNQTTINWGSLRVQESCLGCICTGNPKLKTTRPPPPPFLRHTKHRREFCRGSAFRVSGFGVSEFRRC